MSRRSPRRTRFPRPLGPVLLVSLLLGACGYFNSYYNAQRRFGDAERASRRGAFSEASTAYRDAIERAAVSYRKHPDSRWADDALLLIARSRFAMGEYEAARAALGRVLQQNGGDDVHATASLYLGASLVRLGHADSAAPYLQQGLAGLDGGSELHALGELWLGRARLDRADAAGWENLERVGAREGPLAMEALLELGVRALAADDSARGLRALAALARQREAQVRVDSTLALVRLAGTRWGAARAAAALPAEAVPGWPGEVRTRLGLERAELLAESGDTAAAVDAAVTAAEQSAGSLAGQARQAAARWLLARADSVEDLAQVRAILLPAVKDASAVLQVRRVRTLDVLLEHARNGQSAALFAAAEFARDTLGSRRLARQLFLTYADVAASSVWAPKALLAALPLSSPAEHDGLQQRIGQYRDNPYVAAVRGERTDAAAYYSAEERLGRAVEAVRADAAAAALTGDLRVGRAVAVLDSLRLLARTDSVRVRCGSLLDSLGLRGIRADSVRTACLRSDSAGIKRFLAIDTTKLRDSVATKGARPRTGLDTISAP